MKFSAFVMLLDALDRSSVGVVESREGVIDLFGGILRLVERVRIALDELFLGLLVKGIFGLYVGEDGDRAFERVVIVDVEDDVIVGDFLVF